MTEPDRLDAAPAIFLGFFLGMAVTVAASALADAVLSRPAPPPHRYDGLTLPPPAPP